MTGKAAGSPRLVVVGGGIAGLAAAHRLTQLAPAAAVTLVEAGPRLGGKIVTERVDGFLIEGGPDSFLAAKPRGVGLSRELGLGDRLRGPTPRPHRAYVRAGAELHELPEGLSGLVPTRLGPLLRSGLLSPRGKARLALDFLLPPRRDEVDESLASFVRRRLGGEAYDRLVEPLMAGIYGGDGDQLSVAATFPHLRQGELDYGGLIRGVRAARRGAAAAGAGQPAFLAPAGGMGELVTALGEVLGAAGVCLRLGVGVEAIARAVPGESAAYRVRLADGTILDADGVIVATPADVAGQLLAGLDPELAGALRAIPHVSTAIVTLAYRQEEIPRPLDAHGYLVPRIAGRPVLACTWTSAKWADRAPAGHELIRLFLGRAGQEAAAQRGDEELLVLARAEVGQTLGVTASPALARINRWPRGMPQYVLGHHDRLATIERRLADHPGLRLAGNSYRGVGIPDSIASGEVAASALVEESRSRGVEK